MTGSSRVFSATMLTLALAGALGVWHGSTATHAQVSSRPASRHASVTAGMDCSACHTPEGWGMSSAAGAGGGFDHSRTGFPLIGRHTSTPCLTCHQPGVEMRRACNACHEDAHQSRLGRDCERCHTAQRWNDTRPLEMHRTTRLPLTGMHALLDCTECHRRSGDREFTAVPADCFACHETEYRRTDIHPLHVGHTDATLGCTVPPFPRDCAICHTTTGWVPAFETPSGSCGALTSTPDHEALFAIRSGPHRDLPCASCHVAAQVPRAVECVGCHAHDPVRLRQLHLGQSYATDGAGCLGCHPGGSAR